MLIIEQLAKLWTNFISWMCFLTMFLFDIYWSDLILCLTTLLCRRSASWAWFCWFVNSVTWHHFVPPACLQGVIVIHLNTLLPKLLRAIIIITTIIMTMRIIRSSSNNREEHYSDIKIKFREHYNSLKFQGSFTGKIKEGLRTMDRKTWKVITIRWNYHALTITKRWKFKRKASWKGRQEGILQGGAEYSAAANKRKKGERQDSWKEKLLHRKFFTCKI